MLQMQSSFVFSFQESCSRKGALDLATAIKKRGAECSAPLLKEQWLEVEFRNKLHYARIVGEGSGRIIEMSTVNPHESSDPCVSN